MTRPPITVVIPTLGMRPMLALCLDHLARSLAGTPSAGEDRIVVLDNATEPPLPPIERDGVSWIRLDQPTGFAACCNRGMRHAPNPWYLMLNNDVILHDLAVAAMADCLAQDPSIGICGSRLVFPDGTVQHAGIRFGPVERGPYHEHRGVPSERVPREVRAYQAVTAACMLIRGEALDAVGGFEEAYSFSFEDIDLCLRVRQAGWRVVCAQAVESLHMESMTPGRLSYNEEARATFLARWEGRWSIDG